MLKKVYKISGQAEAVRVKNYSYDALEKFVSNAVYHKSYQIPEPITIRIEKDKIEITSLPGPDRSISDDDIKSEYSNVLEPSIFSFWATRILYLSHWKIV